MNIKFNMDKVKKVLKRITAGILAGYVIYAGSVICKRLINGDNTNKYPQLKQIRIFDEEEVTELNADNITYTAPAGYTLETINNHVYAVKRYYIVTEPEKITAEDGTVSYYAPADSVMVDGLVYREVIELKEPDKRVVDEIMEPEVNTDEKETDQKVLVNAM